MVTVLRPIIENEAIMLQASKKVFDLSSYLYDFRAQIGRRADDAWTQRDRITARVVSRSLWKLADGASPGS